VAGGRRAVAQAEIALVSRDLGWPSKALDAARVTLEEHGDRVNAAHARYLEVRRFLLIGRIDEAESRLAAFDITSLPPASRLFTSCRSRGSRFDASGQRPHALRSLGPGARRTKHVYPR
jgi:hypothetical protein